jgi:hypothetical protein
MAAAAHNPEFARKAGIPVSVAKEFYEADQRKPTLLSLLRSKPRNRGS